MIACTRMCRLTACAFTCIVCSIAGLIAGCSGAKVRVAPAMTITGPGVYHLGKTSFREARTLDVTLVAEWPESMTGKDWAADDFLLTVTSDQGDKVLDEPFCSSYGDFQIDLIDLTGDGREEYVFLVGEGRGTSARREWLIVRQERDGHFVDILREVRSDYFGSGATWWYDYAYVDIDDDGATDLELTLDHSPTDIATLQTPEDIPREKVKQYRWDPQFGRMKPSDR